MIGVTLESAPAPAVAHGSSCVAVRPFVHAIAGVSRSGRRVVRKDQRASTPVPRMSPALVVAASAALAVGGLLAVLQSNVWVLIVFEVAAGACMGVALVPLRRHPETTRAVDRWATGLFVVLAYAVYLALGCALRSVSPLAFFSGASLSTMQVSMGNAGLGAGFGAALFVFKIGVSWTVARAVLRLSSDELLEPG